MQGETQRQLQAQTQQIKSYEGEFQKSKLIFFMKQKVYIVIRDFVIYLYKSRQHFSKSPLKPEKYFNMNTLQAQVKGNSLIIKDCQFQECLTHGSIEQVNELMNVIENNRRVITMEKMFPRRFQDLDEKICEKRMENQKVDGN